MTKTTNKTEYYEGLGCFWMCIGIALAFFIIAWTCKNILV